MNSSSTGFFTRFSAPLVTVGGLCVASLANFALRVYGCGINFLVKHQSTISKISTLSKKILTELKDLISSPILILRKKSSDSKKAQCIKEAKTLFSPENQVDSIEYSIKMGKCLLMCIKEDASNEISSYASTFLEKTSKLILKNEADLNNLLVDSMLPEFKSNVSFKELSDLKHLLSALVYLQADCSPQLNSTKVKFTSLHSIVRQFYYEKFSSEHITNKIEKNGHIASLGYTPENSKYVNKKEVLEKLKLVFDNPDLARITWVHGTTSATIVGVVKAQGQLMPGGALRENALISFAGEQNGAGISIASISGVPLKSSSQAVDYASGGIGFHDKLGMVCSLDPQKAIELYTELFNDWIKGTHTYQEIYSDYENKNLLNNFHRHMKILWSLEPVLFQTNLLPKINEYITELNEIDFKNDAKEFCRKNYVKLDQIDSVQKELSQKRDYIIQEMLNPVLSFKERLPIYSDVDKKIIRTYYPTIFASTNLEITEVYKSDSKNKQAVQVKRSMLDEYAYKGNLTLETDLQYMFVPEKNIEETRTYLKNHHIEKTNVYSIENLKAAQSFQLFQTNKSKPKTFKKEPQWNLS